MACDKKTLPTLDPFVGPLAGNDLLIIREDGDTQDHKVTVTELGGGIGPLIDHNSLLNLTVGDVHTQYAFLAGRASDQTYSMCDDDVSVGTITGNKGTPAFGFGYASLVLQADSSPHNISSAIQMNSRLNILPGQDRSFFDGIGSTPIINYTPTFTATGGVQLDVFLEASPNITTQGIIAAFITLAAGGSLTTEAPIIASLFALFASNFIVKNTAVGSTPPAGTVFGDLTVFSQDGGTGTTGTAYRSFRSATTYETTNSASWILNAELISFVSEPFVRQSNSTFEIEGFSHFKAEGIDYVGASDLGFERGFSVADFEENSGTTVEYSAYYSEMAEASNRFALNLVGDAKSFIGGELITAGGRVKETSDIGNTAYTVLGTDETILATPSILRRMTLLNPATNEGLVQNFVVHYSSVGTIDFSRTINGVAAGSQVISAGNQLELTAISGEWIITG